MYSLSYSFLFKLLKVPVDGSIYFFQIHELTEAHVPALVAIKHFVMRRKVNFIYFEVFLKINKNTVALFF